MAVSVDQILCRVSQLERMRFVADLDGADPDSYNSGWLDGAVLELVRLLPPGTALGLIEDQAGWVCPDCSIWIDPTEIGCGCGRIVPPNPS